MRRTACCLAVVATAVACGKSGPPHVDAPATIVVTSLAYAAGGHLPADLTCRGAAKPIPLRLSGVPATARELVLTMLDPDAPGGTFTHWVVYGIAPATTAIETGVVPAGAVVGRAYKAPCPPGSGSHHYDVTVYALDAVSGLPPDRSATQVVRAVRDHVVAQGSLVGLFP